jgi:hypothetical protein
MAREWEPVCACVPDPVVGEEPFVLFTEGDEVITYPDDSLKDGAKVKRR